MFVHPIEVGCHSLACKHGASNYQLYLYSVCCLNRLHTMQLLVILGPYVIHGPQPTTHHTVQVSVGVVSLKRALGFFFFDCPLCTYQPPTRSASSALINDPMRRTTSHCVYLAPTSVCVCPCVCVCASLRRTPTQLNTNCYNNQLP